MKSKHKKRLGKSKSFHSSNEVSQKKSKKKKTGDTCSKKEIDKIRKKQLLEANKEEEKTIKRLEKLLRIDKKKKKGSIGLGDGLDYLLEVIDRKDDYTTLSDDLEEDLAAVEESKTTLGSKRKKNENSEIPQSKRRTLTDLLREKQGYISESEKSDTSLDDKEFSDIENESDKSESNKNDDLFSDDIAESDDNENESECLNTEDKMSKSKVWEDIYGRFRDEKGNILKNTEVQKYIPPNLRKSSITDQKQEELLKIKRNLKGLLNRLSESNLQPISHQVEEMYMKHGRNDMNESLFSLISDLVLTPIQTAPRLIMEQAMLIALLHANVGVEIGAFFLQHLIMKLDNLFKMENYGEGKTSNNILTFLSHLYNFKVAHSGLIFDIFRKLINSFKDKDIELIQMFLKNIGFILRKDDPVSLKEIVFSIQEKAATINKEKTDSRVSFMLDTLIAIRNNNIYKIPDYDPSIIEHSKKVLKAYVRKGCSLQELAVSYEDLVKADEKGRWWIVGSAWSENETPSTSKTNQNSNTLPKSKYSEKLLELARKQHMNTDVRKSIFCIIMSAEDYMDAFQKLMKLNIKHQQEQEIINVILHCVLQEKKYNPFYSYLAGKFCSFARKYQMALQFSLWDKFKELNNMKMHQIRNLASFLSQCFTSLTLPLSVLKVIHLSEMDNTMLKFIRQILLAVLLHDSEETCIQVFSRISIGKNLHLLRESLRLFMHHFMLKNTAKFSNEVAEKLKERIKVAETALSSSKKT